MNDKDSGFDVITVGDSTIDTFIKIHDASVECDIHHEDCKICLKYGDKIPVDAIGHGVAGNAANVVSGCAKLGLSSAIYTNLGDDQAGGMIKNAFEDEGVALDYVQVNSAKESNLSVIINFQGERTALVYHQSWFYKLPKLAKCSWLYFTSISESFTTSNIVEEVCHYVDVSGAKLAFSPGTYQLRADVKRYPRLLEKCALLIVNEQEAKRILNIDMKKVADPKDILAKLHLLGPKTVVITDGADGSFGSDGKRTLKLGIFPVQVYEKTGAGDAYTSALISGLFYGLGLAEAMVWGALNSASCIQKLGPQNGLLTRAQIERNRKVVGELVATEF